MLIICKHLTTRHCHATALRDGLVPETTAALYGSTQGQASSLPRRHTAPGARLLTVYGWLRNGHLPPLLRRSLEPVLHAPVRMVHKLVADAVLAGEDRHLQRIER